MTKKIALLLCFLVVCGMSFALEIDDRLIQSIIEVESGGNPNAVGSAGEIGIYQISPIVLTEYNNYFTDLHRAWGNEIKGIYAYYEGGIKIKIGFEKEDLFNPENNRTVAVWYLERLRDYYLKDIKVINIRRLYLKGENVYELNTRRFFSLKDFPDIRTVEDMQLALIFSAWNGGITRLRKHNYDINKMPVSTRAYVKKVLKIYETNNP